MQWQLPHLANDYCLAVIGQTMTFSEKKKKKKKTF